MKGSELRVALGSSGLPGRPDFLVVRSKLAIFVDGCFWHAHPRCYRPPVNNAAYWVEKRRRNRRRRLRVITLLREAGWRHLAIWECEIKRHPREVLRKVARAAS